MKLCFSWETTPFGMERSGFPFNFVSPSKVSNNIALGTARKEYYLKGVIYPAAAFQEKESPASYLKEYNKNSSWLKKGSGRPEKVTAAAQGNSSPFIRASWHVANVPRCG